MLCGCNNVCDLDKESACCRKSVAVWWSWQSAVRDPTLTAWRESCRYNISYHYCTILYHAIQYHTIQYCTLLFSIITYNTVQCHSVSCHTALSMPFSIIPYYTVVCHSVLYQQTLYHAIQYHSFIPYNIVLCHSVAYHIRLYHAIQYYTRQYCADFSSALRLYCLLLFRPICKLGNEAHLHPKTSLQLEMHRGVLYPILM